MEEVLNRVSRLCEKAQQLTEMDLEAIQDYLGDLQLIFLEMLSIEPKKGKTEKRRLWKAQLKELNEAIASAEEKEQESFELRYPKLRHYCSLIDQERTDLQWLDLKDEVSQWLAGCGQETREQFEASGYLDELEARCQGLSRPDPEEPDMNYFPLPFFLRYLPLLYKDERLWTEFRPYLYDAFAGRGQDFFAFDRDTAAQKWQSYLSALGPNIPMPLIASGAYLLLRHAQLGHDLDEELGS